MPVQTSFQVDIEIYEGKLGQSGDRILVSHITMMITNGGGDGSFNIIMGRGSIGY